MNGFAEPAGRSSLMARTGRTGLQREAFMGAAGERPWHGLHRQRRAG